MSAARLLEEGWRRSQAGDARGAETLFRQALSIAPDSADGWCYLGIVLYDQARYHEAARAYQRALAIKARFPVALNNLGNTLAAQGRLSESLLYYRRAAEINPDYANTYANMAKVYLQLAEPGQSRPRIERALALEPENAEFHKTLALLLLQQGEFQQGWAEYEWRWSAEGLEPLTFDQPQWDGSPLRGKTILLVAEQGIGDAIMFSRYAGCLKQVGAGRVVMQCRPPLVPLLSRCQGVDAVVVAGDALPPLDVYVPMMSLPHILGHGEAEFPRQIPYLSPDPRLVRKWKERLVAVPGLKVGVAWRGNPGYAMDHLRSIPAEYVAGLARIPDVRLVSLHPDATTEELPKDSVIDLGETLDEQTGPFMDTAALMTQLDLVIAADTAVAHLAGALGRPLWVALSRMPDWRWMLDRDDSPWYPTARLFRQAQPGAWQAVFGRINSELAKLSRRASGQPLSVLAESAAALAQTEAEPSLAPPQGWSPAARPAGSLRLKQCRHGLMLYNINDIYIGRSLDSYGEFSEAESRLFRKILKPGDVVVEAGAHIGVHTVAIARRVGRGGVVHAFEPQRLVFQNLCANVALNGFTHVYCHHAGLGDKAGPAFTPPLDSASENNFAGLSLSQDGPGERVRIETVDQLQLRQLDLFKVDVEGMELAVLRGAERTIRQFAPILYVENDRPDRAGALTRFIDSLGYRIFWHKPPIYEPDNFFENPTNLFDGIVSLNILCLPPGAKVPDAGLEPVRVEDFA